MVKKPFWCDTQKELFVYVKCHQKSLSTCCCSCFP